MRSSVSLPSLAAVAIAAAAVSTSPAALADPVIYRATLTGAAEAPPNASPGTGTAIVTLDDDTFLLRVQATFSGLSSPTAAAHIHCCTAVAGTGLAGVATQVPTFPGFPLGVTAGTYDQTFNLSLASSYNPAFITANGGTVGSAFAVFATGLDAGQTYFNIHTTAFPGGEIRGFLSSSAVTPIPEPETYALMFAGLGAVGWAARRRSRQG